jgi:hypothetical protein
VLLAWSALIFGATGLAYVAHCWQRARAARTWPTVTGELAERRLLQRGGELYGQHGVLVEYVSYRYRVGGRPYRNDRVGFGPALAPRSVYGTAEPAPSLPEGAWVQRRAETALPTGSAVRVYYDPADPRDSTLLPVVRPGAWLLGAVAVGLLAAGTWGLAIVRHAGP